VIAEGHPVCSVAQQWGVSRQTLHTWLARNAGGEVLRAFGISAAIEEVRDTV
jgi:transposase-like protein